MSAKSILAPRNPLVAAAKFKKAGAHGKSGKAQRRADKVQRQRELRQAPPFERVNKSEVARPLLLTCSLVAQSVEHATVNRGVRGSNPLQGAMIHTGCGAVR